MSFPARLLLAVCAASTALITVTAPAPAQAAPIPASTVSADTTSPLIGDEVGFVVTFDNADAADAGYGPYLDLTFDSAGADGDDGITFARADYLGAPLTPLATFACTGAPQTHPLTGLSIACPAGKQIVVIQLPFGSFTPGQPVATVNVVGVVSNLADVGFGLGMSATPGFAYGDSATGSSTIIGTSNSTTLNPEILRFVKTYVGPEEETATGPNFPREYTLDVDIATGQTVVDLAITDRLPTQYAYLSSSPSPGVGTTSPTPPVGVPSDPPNNVLTHSFTGNTVGTAAAVDASLDFSFFIPRDDTTPAAILSPTTGDDRVTLNDGEASGTVDPLDPRDANVAFTINSPTVANANDDDARVTAKSIAVQKSVAIVNDVGGPGPTPGDTLQYTINGQVSDYFTFADIDVDDVLSDGQTFNDLYTPTLSIDEAGTSTAVVLTGTPDFFTVDDSKRVTCPPVLPDPTAGTTAIQFQVSDAYDAGAGDGILTGGRVNGATTAGTTFQITFQTIIDDSYACPPPDTSAIDPNDFISNDVSVTGEVYDNPTQLPQTTPLFESDGSGTELVISPISVEKGLWARNGTVGGFATNPAQFAAGDTISYRLELNLPSSDFSDLEIADYLPLPVLQATALTKQAADCTGSTAPGLNQWCFGPGDTLHTASGFVTPGPPAVDTVANSITWDFGTQEFSDNLARTIQIIFTLEISDSPFRDGLFLTNQVQVDEENSFNTAFTSPAIIQIELTEPALNIRKGAVAASAQTPAASFSGPRNPTGVSFDAVTTTGSCPDFGGTVNSNGIASGAPNANVSGIDRDDLVRFAIVVENTGSGINGAFDVEISDVIPTGFELPSGGVDLCVTNGAGTPITNTATGFFTGAASTSGTIALDDGASTGSLSPADPTSGTNIAVITYVLQLVDTIGANTPAADLTNTATLDSYAATEAGPSFVPITPVGDLTDTASAATKPLTVAKQRTNTSQPSTSGGNVAIGEEVEYTVTVTVPEGVSRNVTLVDTLPAGLEISRPPGAAVLGSDLSATAVTAPSLSANRRVLTYGFGDITNSDSDNATTANETITFTYWAVVTNVNANQRGTVRTNSARASYFRGATGTTTSSAVAGTPVTVVEPTLRVTKAASSPTIDAADTITYSITVDHAPSSNADSFEVALTDVIPAGLTFQTGTLASTSPTGPPPTTLTFTGPDTIDATWTDPVGFPQGSSTTITFDVAVAPGYDAVSSITNTASVTYTGLPGSPTTALGNPNGVERTGAGGVNDYATSGSVVIQPIAPSISKALVDTDQATTTSPDVTIGEIVTYDLTVTMPEGNISGLTVTDQLPAGMQYVAGTLEVFTANGTETPTAGLAQSFAGTLGAPVITGGAGDGDDVIVTFGATTVTPDSDDTNNSFVVRLDAQVLDATGNVGFNPGQTTLNNRGVVQLDGSAAVNSGFVGTPVVEPRMSITKSFDPTTASQGDTVTVNVQVENTGLGIAHDIVVDDVLDAAFDEATALEGVTPAGFTYARSGNTITYTGGPIAVGATIDFSFTVALDPVVPIGTAIPNTARVTQATTLPGTVAGERDEPDVSAPAVLNSVGPDLRLSKDDGITTIAPGAQTTYDLVVTNDGGFQATGVFIDDTLPPGTTFVSVGGASCSDGGLVSGAQRILIAGAIPPSGGTVTCTITIEMTAPAAAGTSGYLNQAVVTDDGVNGSDPTPGNNMAMDNDTIAGRAPDVQVTKDDGVTAVAPGGQTTYTIVVTNAGNIGVTNVLVTDTLPAGLTFAACNELTGTVSVSCAESGGIVTITYASLAGGGGSASFEVVADVDDPMGAGIETVDNTVTAADDGANGVDPTPANNSDNDIDTVTALPDMVIVKTHTQANVSPGGTVDYQLTVSNAGDQNATGVIVTDTVDPQMTVTCGSVSPAATSCNPSTGVITWGPGLEDDTNAIAGVFIAGESVTLSYSTVADNPLLAGTTRFDNTATVTDDDGTANGDPTPANNTDVDTVPLASNAPELSIVKDDGLTNIVPGQSTTYTLTVTNNGNIGATGVVVSDTLPAELEFVSCSNSCDSTALPLVTWTIGSLAGGGATTAVTLEARVVDPIPAGVASITNPASVVDDGANGADPVPGNNTDDDIDIVDATPELVVIKDDGATQRAAGETFDYTIVVVNNGDQAATGVTVVDTLPAILTADSCPSNPVPCTIDNTAGTVTWNVGNLNGGADQLPPAAGSSITLTVTVTIDDTVASGINSFTNSVRAADDGTNSGGTPVEDTDDDTDVLDATPDLLVTKDDGVTSAAPGDTLEYDIVVTNVGSQSATGVTVTDTLPPGVTFMSCTPTCDDTGLPTIVWTNVVEDVPGTPVDPGAFDAAGQATLTVTVTVDTPALAGVDELDNVVAAADDGANGVDPTPGNNSDNDLDVLDAAPDLVVSKTDGVLSVVEGQTLDYDITFTNAGNQTATGVVITDILPGDVSFVGCTDACDSTGDPTIVWNVGDLAPGDGDTYTVTAIVDDPLDPGTRHVINSVSIADDGANGADPTPGNNSDTDDDTYGIDLAVTKTDGRTTVVPGENVTYTVTVTNNGPTTIQDFNLTETLPAALSDVTFAPSAGTYDSVSGQWTGFGDFDEGESLTLEVSARIDPAATGSLTNSVRVTAPDFVPDSDPTNDVAVDVDTLDPQSNLVINKQLTTELVLGEAARYDISVRNDGPSVAVDVQVVDVLPAGLTFQSVIAPGWNCVNEPTSTVTCSLDDPLTVNDNATFTLVVGVNAPGGSVITNTATVSSAGVLGVGSQPTDADTGTVSASPNVSNVPLPRTGAEMMRIVLIAFALVIVGAVLLVGKRRRVTTEPSA